MLWVPPESMAMTQDPIDWRYLPYIRPIFEAYVSEYHHKIWPYMVQWLGGSDLELGVLEYSLYIPYSMGSQGATNRVSEPSNRILINFATTAKLNASIAVDPRLACHSHPLYTKY